MGILYPPPLLIGGPISHQKYTRGVCFYAKFYFNRFIVSSLCCEKPQILPHFHLKGSVVVARGQVEAGCTMTNLLLSNGIESTSIFKCIDGKVVSTKSANQKCDRQKPPVFAPSLTILGMVIEKVHTNLAPLKCFHIQRKV